MSMRNSMESGNTTISLFLNPTTSKVVWHDSRSPAGRHPLGLND